MRTDRHDEANSSFSQICERAKTTSVVDTQKKIKKKVILKFICFVSYVLNSAFRDSSVRTATRYGLDAPGLEFRWVEIFRTRSERPTQPPTPGYQVIPEAKATGM